MSELSPIKNLKNLKSDMANMTYGEKLNHIWTYYKWVLVVVLLLIMAVSVLLASLQNLSKKTLVAGVTVNVFLSDEGKAALSEDYKALVGTGSSKEEVYLSHTDIENPLTATSYDENYYAVLSLLALCSNEELDYLIMDQEGFETMLVQGAYLDLNNVYTTEELEAMGDHVIYAQDKDTDSPAPMALDITDCAFIQENTDQKGPIYFVFVGNSPRTDACREFYDYLISWKAE